MQHVLDKLSIEQPKKFENLDDLHLGLELGKSYSGNFAKKKPTSKLLPKLCNNGIVSYGYYFIYYFFYDSFYCQ